MESRMITLTGVFLCVHRWAALCMESRMTTLTDHYTSLQFVPLCVQLGCFVYYCMESRMITLNGPVPVHSIFIYRPDRRLELWRFVLYMLLHAG